MKIILIEDLETDLQERAEENKNILSQLTEIFDAEDFEVKNEINGTSFSKSDGSISATFYVNNDMSYKGYVTNDTENSSNLSVKGNADNAIKAAEQVVSTFYKELESEDL